MKLDGDKLLADLNQEIAKVEQEIREAIEQEKPISVYRGLRPKCLLINVAISSIESGKYTIKEDK
jgi:hypothetical protein